MSTTANQKTTAKHVGSYNVCNVELAHRDIRVSSGKVRCACGREFLPNNTRKKFCDHACYSASIRVPIEQRFWTKVNKNGPPPAHLPRLGGCWLWIAKAQIRGYGSIAGVVNGKRRPLYAHRVSWELTYGPIEGELEVLHRCDTPLCVRPDHLFLGTQQENLADARAKGRLDESRPRLRQPFQHVHNQQRIPVNSCSSSPFFGQ
jgi:hypothetical protein